jgi:hypothetical protein
MHKQSLTANTRHKRLPSLFDSDIAPIATNHRLAYLRRVFACFVQLADKENLLETDLSAGAVVVHMTMQQALMRKPRVAITVTRLLRQYIGNVFR